MPHTLYLFPIFRLFISAVLPSLFFTSSAVEIPLTYADCTSTYSCGHIHRLTYPFAGGDRPDHCGLPDFKLTCFDDLHTGLTHNSETFRVLNVDPPNKALTLAREDLYNTTCPTQFFNTTLNSTLFEISDHDSMLTIIYGCNSPQFPAALPNEFTCDIRNVNFTTAYYKLGPVPSDPEMGFIYCNVSVKVPLRKEAGDSLRSNRGSLQEALMEGFRVNYRDPYESMCNECNEYGGQCGFDSNLGVPLCLCGDRPCPVTLAPLNDVQNASTLVGASSKNQTALGIGLAIAGAVVAGIGIGWSIFFCRRRRRRILEQTGLSTDTESRERKITSSKALISPPSNTFTRSIPSFPTPKSNLGRGSSYFGVQIFSYNELKEATDNFNRSRELGDGGFGAVYHGVLRDGRVVAVKRLYENNFKRVEQFMNEVEILARLRHQNLVQLYGCTSKSSPDLLLVYEFIPNGTVADHLHGTRASSGLLSWPVRLKIAVETADALTYLHSSKIIHRDVKTTNILLDSDFHVKVADFGLSRLFPTNVTHVSTAPQGTPGYVDPEYYQIYRLTEKSDVFSFGVVLVELISSLQAVDTDRDRYDINLANMAVTKIQNDALHELVDQSLGFQTNRSVRRMTTLVAELAFRCLQQEKDMRPSMQEVLDTLREIQNEELKFRKPETVEIVVDEVALLKGIIDLPSPDSVLIAKGHDSSTSNSM